MQLDEITHVLRRFREECSLNDYNLPYERDLPFEEELLAILRQAPQLSESDLKIVRESIDLHLAVLLNRFARRMANAAVRVEDDDRAGLALTAISLDKDVLDDRDVYRTGALIIDSLKRRSLNVESVFERNLKLATESRRALLNHQLRTAPAYMRSLNSMSFGVIESGTDFKYVDELCESPVPINEGQVSAVIEELLKTERKGLKE